MSVCTAKVIAGHISAYSGQKITTFEVTFPRIILSQENTHRALSRNTSSSRAQPVSAVLEQLEVEPFVPERFPKNISGMSAKESLTGEQNARACEVWEEALGSAMKHSDELSAIGVHKQLANRLTEPFQYVRMIITATELDNFFWLRMHKDAQPEIADLAKAMWDAMQAYEYTTLNEGEWHLPYYGEGKWSSKSETDDSGYTLLEAQKISVSCCAQVSYRKNDDSLERLSVFGRFSLKQITYTGARVSIALRRFVTLV